MEQNIPDEASQQNSGQRGALHSISIQGIHGNPQKRIEAAIRDNTLIIVGENGSGKTTFLRILFHFLSGRWLALIQFSFETITVKIDSEEFIVTRAELSRGMEKLDRRFLQRFPPNLRRRYMQLIETGQVDRVAAEMEKMGMHVRFPAELFVHQPELFWR